MMRLRGVMWCIPRWLALKNRAVANLYAPGAVGAQIAQADFELQVRKVDFI